MNNIDYISPNNYELLIAAFKSGKLSREAWTHSAHLVVAAWYCYHFDLKTAMAKLRYSICFLQ